MKSFLSLMLIALFALSPERSASGAESAPIEPKGLLTTSTALVRPVVLLRDQRSLRAAARHDYGLTKACRQGEFLQSRVGHYVAVLDGEIYGAAVGGLISLIDPRDLAKARRIYLFIGQGASYCRVFTVEEGPSHRQSSGPTA